jgi:hypothetical protein
MYWPSFLKTNVVVFVFDNKQGDDICYATTVPEEFLHSFLQSLESLASPVRTGTKILAAHPLFFDFQNNTTKSLYLDVYTWNHTLKVKISAYR